MPCKIGSMDDIVLPKGWELCPCSGIMPIEHNKQRVTHVKSMCHQRWLGEQIQKDDAAKMAEAASQSLPCTAPLPEQ